MKFLLKSILIVLLTIPVNVFALSSNWNSMSWNVDLWYLDSDGDGVPNNQDAFPYDRNEWLDTDGDGVGNNADLDDDGDGMPDKWELTYNLNPIFDDGAEDADGDGYSNLIEYQFNTNPRDTNSVPKMEESFPWELFYPAFIKKK